MTASSFEVDLDSCLDATTYGTWLPRLSYATYGEKLLKYESTAAVIEILQENQSIVKVVRDFDSSKLKRYTDLRYRCLQNKDTRGMIRVT